MPRSFFAASRSPPNESGQHTTTSSMAHSCNKNVVFIASPDLYKLGDSKTVPNLLKGLKLVIGAV